MPLPNAFVTLLTTPSYLPGVLVVLHSLLELQPAPRDFKTVCLVTPETVDAKTIGEVRKAGYDLVIGVEPIGSGIQGVEGLTLMGRPDLNLALTKLHLFRLSSLFSTLIYLDADVLPLRPLSHLFYTTEPHVLSACPDTGWPDCFNSGVMVIRPRESDWEGLRKLLKNGEGEEGIFVEGTEGSDELFGNGSFDGADQGLLNEWFSEEGGGGPWNRLPFLYNVTPTAAYQYEPAYRRYGHKVNAVHFIGPNKPWANLQGRPAGMSMPKGKDTKFDYPSLIDRWYDVYDRNVRRYSALHPDMAQRFTVPEHVAVWNAGTGVADQPSDRLDLDQLRHAVETGMAGLKSGQYSSLPLDGRVDLIMPKPKPRAQQQSTVPPNNLSPSATGDTSPTVISAPPPQTLHQQTTKPAMWDAQRYSPPVGGGPEMSVPMNTYYVPAWDDTPAHQSSFYSAPAPHQEPQFPIIPDSVKQDSWYGQFTSSTPDPSHVHAVFPWEQPGVRHRRPDRVFPRGSSPPRSESHLDKPRITMQQPSPTREEPPTSPSASHPGGRSLQEAMATYTNAWDENPSIQRYVKRVSQRQNRPTLEGAMPRAVDLSSLKSVPNTPLYETVPLRKRQYSGDRRSEASGDGDDEDEGESDISADQPSPAVGSLHGGVFGPGVPFPTGPSNQKYRDGQTQTDRIRVSHAKVQANPGGGTSPAMRIVDLPGTNTGATVPMSGSRMRQRGSSQSEQDGAPSGTAPGLPYPISGNGNGHGNGNGSRQPGSSTETTPRSTLVTPLASDHGVGHLTAPTRLAYPTQPKHGRRLSSNNGNGSTTATGGETEGPGQLRYDRRRSSGNSVEPKTDNGIPAADARPTRKFDPSTDLDARRMDSERVLKSFMSKEAGAFR